MPEAAPVMLAVEGLRHAYPDGTEALCGVDLVVAEGERVALLGPNGAGKSTLLLHLAAVLAPQGGTVALDGIAVGPATVRDIRAQVGLVFQDPDDQLFMATVHDDVAFGPLNLGLSAPEVDRRVHEALHAVGLADAGGRPGQHLSFGQRKRAALATVLAMRPRLLVLDEPSSNLDPRTRRQMLGLLTSAGSTLVVATHDMDLAWELCGRAVLLDGGRVVADGPASEVMRDQALLEAHGLELPHLLQSGHEAPGQRP